MVSGFHIKCRNIQVILFSEHDHKPVRFSKTYKNILNLKEIIFCSRKQKENCKYK